MNANEETGYVETLCGFRHEPWCPAVADDDSDYENLYDAGECTCKWKEWNEAHKGESEV